MRILKNLFASTETEGINLEITKYDVNEMKDTDQKYQDKIDRDLKKRSKIVDRGIVMLYEKKFMEKFKKIGNLDQKCPYCAKSYKTLNLGEKKCIQCSKIFFVKKRVQDMGTVAFRSENTIQFDLQWKAVSKIKKFKFYLPHEYTYIQEQLQKQGKKNVQTNDVMHSVVSAYAKNSLNVGYYELYTAFIFHKAELMRLEQRFAEALVYYFYVHFLQNNGLSNEASFSLNTKMNDDLRQKIVALLSLGNIQVEKSKDIFDYAVKHLNAFNISRMPVNIDKSYSFLMKEFKIEDTQKQKQKPMRSFVLYTKAS